MISSERKNTKRMLAWLVKNFFSDNIGSVIMQASLQGYNLLDCITIIDLCDAPPSIDVKLAFNFLSDDMREEDDNFAHTKRVIQRNKLNGSLTAACISLGTYESERAARAILLKTFPGLSAPGGSWTAAQASLRQSMGNDRLAELQNYPDEIEAQLKDLRRTK